MPAEAPQELITERQQWLWTEMARLFEFYSANNPKLYAERQREYIEVIDVVKSTLIKNGGSMTSPPS